MKAIDKLLSKAIQGITIKAEYGWPPVCCGSIYQPERPVVEVTAEPVEKVSESKAE